MKKVALLLFVLLVTVTVTATAAGDKVRGEKGEGQTRQMQERNTDQGTPAYCAP